MKDKGLKEWITDVTNKLAELISGLKATSEDIVYYERPITTSYAAGTIGTRGAQVSFANPAPSSYYIRAISLVYVGDSASYHPLAFYSNGNFYVNFYRCSTGAVSNAAVTVRILYTKSIGGGAIHL